MNARERERHIQQRRESTGRNCRVWCKGEWRTFEIFRVEIDALLLNVDNRRFAAERKLMEHKLGHSLDPESSPQDLKSVIAILLYKNLDVDGDVVTGTESKDYVALKSDWIKRKQETPFWIRPDGTVRNGNRRLAMLHLLREEQGGDAFDWVEVIILAPDAINEDDLFEMEQREQLTENFKVRYTDINLLLTLKDAANAKDIDWADAEDIDRVAGELQEVAGGDRTYAIKQLRAIRFMDAYLEDSGAPGEYHKILRQVERFRDVGNIMAKMEEQFPDDAPDMLRLAFAAIRGGNPHGHIRQLWPMFRDDRDRYQELLAQIEGEERDWESTRERSGLDNPDLHEDADSEDDDAQEPPGPEVPNYPKDRVRSRIQNAVDGFAATNLDVLSKLTQALDRLQTLTQRDEIISDALRGDGAEEIREKLNAIITWAEGAKERHGS